MCAKRRRRRRKDVDFSLTIHFLLGREERKSNSKLSHKTDDDAMMCGKHKKKEWGKGEVFEKALRSEMITTVSLVSFFLTLPYFFNIQQ